MATRRKTQNDSDRPVELSRLRQFNPRKTFLFFGLVGSTVLFLAMAFVFLLTLGENGVPHDFEFPKSFAVSTVLILLNSFMVTGTSKAFREDDTRTLKAALIGTLILTITFCAVQAYSWNQLFDANLKPETHNGIAFLYILSGLHFLHVVAGLGYQMYITHTVFRGTSDIVRSLLFYSDDLNKTRIQLAAYYWHFVDALWVFLFFLFLFGF